jgi:tetratricopeptide (TPR) repeat protein
VVLAAAVFPVTWLVAQRQVAVLVADAAARRAQLAEPTSDFVAAIRATQDSIAFVPWEGEYYSLLGQYYGALAPKVSGPGVTDLAVSLPTALRLRQPAALTRDQVFELGRVSLEAAIQRNPLEARFYTTLGQLYRYWDETAGTTTHLPAALAQFETAQRLKPNDVEAQVGAAATRLLAGDYADALQRARQAEALLPAYWYPYDVMAQAYLALQQYGAAYDAADTAIKRGAGWALGYKAPTRADVNRLNALKRNAADLAGIPLVAD